MKLEAKQRLEAATPVFAANIKDFMKSLFGPDAMKHFSKPKLSRDRRTWTAYYEGTLEDSVTDTVYKTLGKPTFSSRYVNFWAIPGKGFISYNWKGGWIEITSAVSPAQWVEMAVYYVDSSPETRFKRYDIETENKVLFYVPYENDGARQALVRLTEAFRRLKLSGWKVKVYNRG